MYSKNYSNIIANRKHPINCAYQRLLAQQNLQGVETSDVDVDELLMGVNDIDLELKDLQLNDKDLELNGRRMSDVSMCSLINEQDDQDYEVVEEEEKEREKNDSGEKSVDFSRFTTVYYTYSKYEYDRRPIIPALMTTKDYVDYQINLIKLLNKSS